MLVSVDLNSKIIFPLLSFLSDVFLHLGSLLLDKFLSIVTFNLSWIYFRSGWGRSLVSWDRNILLSLIHFTFNIKNLILGIVADTHDG